MSFIFPVKRKIIVLFVTCTLHLLFFLFIERAEIGEYEYIYEIVLKMERSSQKTTLIKKNMYKKKSVRKIADDYIQKNKNKTRGGHDRGE